ncbi:DUF6496 domain-containing protein [Benzoatithermus flavus]|uniref:DUF6496 domain-containing protein n=1 Tax=Benzoatithermus flavus TaxID=3108223 RepID=A0ABU8XQ92_9PROT
MTRQSRAQKETVERVMHEFKHGELETHGRKVRNPRQAIAIALHEAGTSKQESEAANRRHLARTKRKERAGQTARAQKEGGRRRASGGDGRTRAELYAEAKRQGIPGRSKMDKAELARALQH